MDENLKTRLLDVSTRQTFGAGDPILFQGDESGRVGLVLSGRAKAVAYTLHGDESWIGYFEPGEFFGHISALTEMPVSFEVLAETPTEAAMISTSRLTQILDEDKDLSRFVMVDLASRLQTMITRLVEALTLSAKGRICAELIRLSLPIGKTPDVHIIRPNPVFVELALRVNSTRETVSRTVSELQKKGIVSREPGAILIHKPDALKNAVQ